MEKIKHFKLEEFLDSSIARQKSISNSPSWEDIEHLNELAVFLDALRKDWRHPISVNSGFRNEKLNAAVGGVSASAHTIGYAADIVPEKGKMEEFKKFVVEWMKDKNFDQCIIEKKKNSNVEWIHIGLYSKTGLQRRMIFSLDA